ncbi:hypothetical protein PMZ80_007660 [Knufia obscura]|uniref:BTB domain-containing protein n=1 Tax=Knufia obscura TaxID=1635080 RepID=A0ABR0RHY1_9EURO|nr:hypothetical protein PMZ80_007660 [Knufia obscura]
MKHRPTESELEPPAVEPGEEVIVFIVGQSNPLRSALHKNLIMAASPDFANQYAQLPKNIPDPPYVIDDIGPSIFQVVWDWLYLRRIGSDYNTSLEDDHFWFRVYKMAERLDILAIMLTAYNRFKSCYSPSSSSQQQAQGRIVPSDAFLHELSSPSGTKIVFRHWTVAHLLWHSLYSPHASEAIQDLQAQHTSLAAQVGQLLPKVMAQPAGPDGCQLAHPNHDPGFATKHGLDIENHRTKALLQNKQYVTPKADVRPGARSPSVRSEATEETTYSDDEKSLVKEHPRTQSPAETLVNVATDDIHDDQDAVRPRQKRSIQYASIDEPQPDATPDSSSTGKRTRRGNAVPNYAVFDYYKERGI